MTITFATREEAFFLEQAVLQLTAENARCPEELLSWHGASELRYIDTEQMIDNILVLNEEMSDLGVWQFAIKYVKMSSTLQEKCQIK